jgi:ribosomal protein S18 acetylase RimI-like enzyme
LIVQLESTPGLARRDWDSDCFGFDVADVIEHELDGRPLRGVLAAARADGYRLVYLAAQSGVVVDQGLLEEFGGLLVDEKVTFARSLDHDSSLAGEHALVVPGKGVTVVSVAPYGEPCARPELIELATLAGEYSRFKTDPSFPPELFQKLYGAWIERSVLGEIADVVLVASAGQAGLAGMVTASVAGSQGSIGLLAVASGMRGRGIGRALMSGAHRWMRQLDATQSRVVSQMANEPASRLYRRMGYGIASVKQVYHFWLNDVSGGA